MKNNLYYLKRSMQCMLFIFYFVRHCLFVLTQDLYNALIIGIYGNKRTSHLFNINCGVFVINTETGFSASSNTVFWGNTK